MPRYKVVEVRAYHSTILIDAENEDAAKRNEGDIIAEEGETYNSWAEQFVSCDEVGEDEEL